MDKKNNFELPYELSFMENLSSKFPYESNKFFHDYYQLATNNET